MIYNLANGGLYLRVNNEEILDLGKVSIYRSNGDISAVVLEAIWDSSKKDGIVTNLQKIELTGLAEAVFVGCINQEPAIAKVKEIVNTTVGDPRDHPYLWIKEFLEAFL